MDSSPPSPASEAPLPEEPRPAAYQPPSKVGRSPGPWRAALVTPWPWLIAFGLGLGIFLRVFGFNYPSFFLFDEHHFVENARNYLAHRADWNDHPPLGKLPIALAIRALGDGPIAWRLSSLVAGFATMLFGGLAARRLFDDKRAGWLAATLLACDGFTIAYSRTALLDGNLAMSCALALLLASYRSTWPRVLAAGVLTGFAASIKFSGGAVAIPLLVGLSLSGLRPGTIAARVAVASCLAVVVYLSQYAFGLHLAGEHASVGLVLSETLRHLEAHAASTEMKNPWVSGWSTWLLPWRALVIGYTDNGRYLRVLSGLGNLAIWWSAMVVGLGTFVVVLRRGLTATLAGSPGVLVSPAESSLSPMAGAPVGLGAFVKERGRGVAIALSGVVGFLAPWVLTHRDSYIYHFLPCYAGLLILLGGYASWLGRRRPRWLLAWLVLVLVVSIIYAPVWSFMAISQAGFKARLFLGTWR